MVDPGTGMNTRRLETTLRLPLPSPFSGGEHRALAPTVTAGTSSAPPTGPAAVSFGARLSLRRSALLPAHPRESPHPDSSERFLGIERIGEGGEADVWRAFDRDLGRMVAIKRAHRIDVNRFAAEVRTAGRLEHPGIVPVHDIGVDADGHPYFVMRLVEGESLERIIERLAAGEPDAHQFYCFEQRIQLFRRLCDAVAFAHARGVLHCDIKPANVLVGRHGEVFLTDWGIACATTAPASNQVAGTPAYMAPEQTVAGPLDARTDVHGLAALLYEWLTLRTYIPTESVSLVDVLRAIPAHRPAHPTDLVSPHQPRVPMDLGWFALRGLERDPARRYPSVDAMLERLERRAEGRVPIQCSQTFFKRLLGELIRLVERRPTALPIAIALGVIVYAVTALLRAG